MALDTFSVPVSYTHLDVYKRQDGDSIYALSTGTLEADLDMVGTLAAQVMSEAILRAVMSAETAYGFPAARDL